jgi:hypothetical protein
VAKALHLIRAPKRRAPMAEVTKARVIENADRVGGTAGMLGRVGGAGECKWAIGLRWVEFRDWVCEGEWGRLGDDFCLRLVVLW